MIRAPRAAGFSLIELLIAMLAGSVLIGTLVALFISQLGFYRQDEAMRDARTGARAALNVLTSDLRMVEGAGGVVSASSTDVTLRVPYLFGVICQSSAAQTDVSLFPADSVTVATAGFSGWGRRNPTTGDWTYAESSPTLTAIDTSTCVARSVTTLTGGRTLRITPGGGVLAPGTPVMLFQRIRYRFAESTSLPGRIGLFRTIVASDSEAELVSPFTDTARFRFFTSWTTAVDSPPADLSTIRGLEIHLNAESVDDAPSGGEPYPFSLVSSVFFMNPND